MYTEDEVKTKWCPHVRHEGEEAGGSWNCNPDDENRPNIRTGTKKYSCACIGSKCAMWRWVVSPKDANEINTRGNAGAIPTGYCGLAGKPLI